MASSGHAGPPAPRNGAGEGGTSEFKPGAQARTYREITISALIFAFLTGIVINAAIAYAGLKIGFTIVGSPIIAVLGFGVLRGLMRKGTIPEINIAQTAGSAIDTTNSGVIFTVPVLFLLGYTLWFNQMNFWLICLACSAGAVLGVAFIIPLRKQMIDVERLRFPSGTAVATILKSPGAGMKKSVVLIAGILAAMLVYLPVGLPQIRVPVPVDGLSRQVEAGKISQGDADRTRLIAEWIDAKAAPVDVIHRGEAVRELRVAAGALAKDQENEEKAKLVESAQAALDKTVRPVSDVPDALAEGAYLASTGEMDWSGLRKSEFGWATKPLWGYSDLGIRLPKRADGDGKASHAMDHDGDGEADLFVTNDEIDLGRLLGIPSEFALVFAIAPFAIGAGYLSGRNGLLVLAGGVLAYHILNPVLFNLGWLPASWDAHQVAGNARATFNRPIGIGMLLGGALIGVLFALPAMKEALRSIARAGKTGSSSDELGLKTLGVAIVGAVILLYFAADFIHGHGADPGHGLLGFLPAHLKYLLIAVLSAVWIWFAGIIIAQCTGMTDWSPISGMALITIVFVMALAGDKDVIGAVLIGASLCCAITLGADMMQDLKTGHLVGAIPRKQQLIELCVAGLGPTVAMLTVLLIVGANLEKYGIPIGEGTDTTAPQAQALEVVIRGFQGGELPYMLYSLGALLGVLLGLGAFPSLGVLVGLSMYLPIIFILTYGVGCIINMITLKVKGKTWSEEWGVPFAAGLIVGEAILSLIINGVILIMGVM